MEARQLLVCLLAITSAVGEKYNKGSVCQVSDGRVGVCADLKECSYAQQVVNSGRIPTTCFFERNRPVVCCPVSDMQSGTTSRTETTSRAGMTPAYMWTTPDKGDHGGEPQCGDACVLDNGGGVGTCTAIDNCPHAARQQEDGEEVQVCYFHRRRPVVCCPRGAAAPKPTSTPTLTSTTVTPRPADGNYGISRRKCLEYADAFLDEVDLPYPNVGEEVGELPCPQLGEPMTIGDMRSRPKENPHMAALGYGESPDIVWLCGGSLVSHRFVLTAASCIDSKDSGRVRWVRLGDLNMESTLDESRPQTVEVEAAIPYPTYQPSRLYHDIALLRLKTRVLFDSYVRPACLHTPSTTRTGDAVVTVGWGLVDQSDTAMSETLMKSLLRVVSHKQCNASYEPVIASSEKLVGGILEEAMLCAGDPEGVLDFCMLDSGSPLQASLEEPFCMTDIVGVASFSTNKCRDTNVPGVFTKVAHYVPWIESVVWSSG